jgi:hypothetical protein
MMSSLLWLADAQVERLLPLFPRSSGNPRVDGRRVLGSIIDIDRNR